MAFPVQLAESVVNEVGNIIRDTKDNVQSGNPTWLRDGTPESVIGKLNQATVRQSCRKWSRETGTNAGTDAGMSRLCTPYLESINEDPGEPTATSPPWTGGQIPGVLYDVRVNVGRVSRRCNGSVATSNRYDETVQMIGPITDHVSERLFEETCCGGNDLSSFKEGVRGFDEFGIEVSNVSAVGVSPGGPCRYLEVTDVTITVTRADGQPDGPGSPPPIYRPPVRVPGPPPGPVTIDINPDFSVDIDVDINNDGTFNFRFNFGGEGTEPGDDPVEVPFDPSPETREPGGEPGDPVTGTPGSEEEGEAGKGEILVGIQVEVESAPPNANVIFTPSGPVYKGAYYAYVGVEDRLDLQPEGATARQTQFFFAPPDSTHWRVSANAGYTTTVTPYYRPIKEA